MSDLQKDQLKTEIKHLEQARKRAEVEAEKEFINYQYKLVPRIKTGIMGMFLIFFIMMSLILFWIFDGATQAVPWFVYLIIGLEIVFMVVAYRLMSQQLTTESRMESIKKRILEVKLEDQGFAEQAYQQKLTELKALGG